MSVSRAVSREREQYWYHSKTLPLKDPEGSLSLVVDGADNNENSIPHTAEQTKTSTTSFRARMHIIGVLAHGHRPYAFTCPGHVKQGHNVTIQAIFDVLVDLFKRNGKLPPVLFLQLDNTTKQNKGTYLSAFLALLIQCGTFKEIYVGFLPVGHTHEDIDQFFSRIAIYFRTHDALSRMHLEHGIQRAYQTREGFRPIVRHWSSLANISGWMDENGVRPIPGCLKEKWRFYKFARSPVDDKVWMQIRDDMHDHPGDEWRGLTDSKAYHLNFKDGIFPDLVEHMCAGTIPPAQRKKLKFTKNGQSYLANRRRDLEKFSELIPRRFHRKHKADCLRMIEMEESREPLPFHWTRADVLTIFEKGIYTLHAL